MSAVETVEIVLALLAVVIALHWAARRLGLPPAVALLVGGGLLAFTPGIPPVALDPELALVFFLPPLLMDGAYYTALGRFRRHLPGIIGLALGAVVFTTLAVGLVVHWMLPDLPVAACFALGAIVSPPDAVSARAILARVNLPRRLSALLEGESLLNDATGLVLFRFAVAATLSGVFDPAAAARSFLWLAIGGAIVGVVIGFAWVFVIKRLGDQTLMVAASVLLCWIAYLAGEAVHVSGVIATVSAGLVLGWYQHIIFTAGVRLRGNAFWQVLVFVIEALIFILIGFSLRGVVDRVGGFEAVLSATALPILAVIATIVVARFVWILGSESLLSALHRLGWKSARPLGWRQAAVLGWTGMRGVVTLAAALSLPQAMPGRDLMLVGAFAVIFATVVVQGTSLPWIIGWVKPQDRDPPAPMDLPASEAAVARAKLKAVEEYAYAPDGTLVHPQMLEQYQARLRTTERYAADADKVMEGLREHFDGILKAVAAGRAELVRQHRAGLIEDETLHNLERDLDLEELAMIFQRDG